MRKRLYFIDRYLRCGAMPLYLIFYKTRQGHRGHYVMLCSGKQLKTLLKQRKGFHDPESYGQMLYKSYESEPDDLLKSILRARYDCDLDALGTAAS